MEEDVSQIDEREGRQDKKYLFNCSQGLAFASLLQTTYKSQLIEKIDLANYQSCRALRMLGAGGELAKRKMLDRHRALLRGCRSEYMVAVVFERSSNCDSC